MYLIKRKVWLLVLVITAAACGEKRPPDVLSKGEMVQILEEVYVAEAQVNQLSISRDSARFVARVINEGIFDSAGITDSVFLRSLDYYMARPDELEDIYTALVDSLQLREQRANQP